MNTKLTLKLDKNIIEKAKSYATQRHLSLSKLVENYFKFLAEKNTPQKTELSSNVKELSGIIKLDENFELDSEYADFLIRKYK